MREPWPCDLVLVRRRRVGRKHYARPGHGTIPKARAEARASANEPWLLAHSQQLRAYRADEIEENFRDTKSMSLGMGLALSRSRSARRLHALLLIHTLAAFLSWHIGQLAEAEGVHRRFNATTRTARELSIITLARLLCAMPYIPITDHALLALNQRLGLRSRKTGETSALMGILPGDGRCHAPPPRNPCSRCLTPGCFRRGLRSHCDAMLHLVASVK